MDLMNLVLLCCLYPILPILYFMLRNETKPKKNIRLGITLPYVHLRDEAVETICMDYRRRLLHTALLLAPWPLLALLLPGFSLPLTVEMLWLIACIIVIHLPYVHAHKQLRALKREHDWSTANADTVVLDIKAAANLEHPQRQIRFLIPILLGCVPFVYAIFAGTHPGQGWMLLTYAILALLPPLFLFCYSIMFRQRTEVISSDSRLNASITNIRRRYWSKGCLFSAWLTAFFNLLLWAVLENWLSALWMILGTVVYTLLLLLVLMQAEFACRRAQEKLSETASGEFAADEDASWILGMVYCDQKDRRTIVANRVGLGTTVNLARPAGKALMIFALVALMAIPCCCAWMIAEEYTPFTAAIEDDALVLKHLNRDSIPLAEIKSISLQPQLPSARRVAGTGMEHLLKGQFDVAGYGMCTLSLDPQSPPFIAIYTAEKTYLINAGTGEADTQALYETLCAALE